MTTTIRTSIAFVALLLATACGGDKAVAPTLGPLASVKVKYEFPSMYVNTESVASLHGFDAQGQFLGVIQAASWTASTPAVSITATGTVTAKKAGAAYIKGITSGGLKDSLLVQVTDTL
ncbi:MAG: hypothetical protein JWO05_3702 [Gemmatimonadetes bacterium]|nr:hypothetical protein [Gemmatimonadota bacterium]